MNMSGGLRRLRRFLPIFAAVALTVSCAWSNSNTAEKPDAGSALATKTVSGNEATTGTSVNRTYADYLAELARSYGIEDPPQVEVVRVVEPVEQREAVWRCLAEAGFPADPSGAINVPEEQNDSLFLAIYTCHAKYPFDDRVWQPLTESQRLFFWRYLNDSAIPCLAELGYDIPKPPSAETYLETAGTPDEYIPSSELFDLGLPQDEIQAAIDKCPDGPPYADVWAQ